MTLAQIIYNFHFDWLLSIHDISRAQKDSDEANVINYHNTYILFIRVFGCKTSFSYLLDSCSKDFIGQQYRNFFIWLIIFPKPSKFFLICKTEWELYVSKIWKNTFGWKYITYLFFNLYITFAILQDLFKKCLDFLDKFQTDHWHYSFQTFSITKLLKMIIQRIQFFKNEN